jgi:hypothetical protein
MSVISTYPELSAELDRRTGVMTVEMALLRDVHGAGKLGVNVVANISEALDNLRVSHWPEQLPLNQWEKVRLYKRGSAVGDLIAAVSALDERNDDVLRKIADDDSRNILRRVRELLCD